MAQQVIELQGAVPVQSEQSLAATVGAYVSLTKPRIISLLLVTTVPAMIVAERGMPSLWLILATLIGGTLAAGGANAINCYLDRDIDGMMSRTKDRPLPAPSSRSAPFCSVVRSASPRSPCCPSLPASPARCSP